MSAAGKDVYVSWNGPQGGDLYVGQSHDFGATWTQQKLATSKRYYYAYDGRVLGDGTVVFSESSVVYSRLEDGGRRGLAPRRSSPATGRDLAERRRRQGAGRRGVRRRRLLPRLLHRADLRGRGRSRPSGVRLRGAGGGPAARSGCTSRRRPTRGAPGAAGTALSAAGENATGPRLASAGGGDVRIWYMQTAGGDNPDAWNVWYRSSSNGGANLVGAGQDRRRPRRRGRLRERGRLRRDLRRLRRDRRHQRREDDRHLGRGLQLHRPRRHLVQRSAVARGRLPEPVSRRPA